jgi:hypothetical protein
MRKPCSIGKVALPTLLGDHGERRRRKGRQVIRELTLTPVCVRLHDLRRRPKEMRCERRRRRRVVLETRGDEGIIPRKKLRQLHRGRPCRCTSSIRRHACAARPTRSLRVTIRDCRRCTRTCRQPTKRDGHAVAADGGQVVVVVLRRRAGE